MRSGTPIVCRVYNDERVDSAVYSYDHDRDSMEKSAPEAPAPLSRGGVPAIDPLLSFLARRDVAGVQRKADMG